MNEPTNLSPLNEHFAFGPAALVNESQLPFLEF